jgi:hypothetical protein
VAGFVGEDFEGKMKGEGKERGNKGRIPDPIPPFSLSPFIIPSFSLQL